MIHKLILFYLKIFDSLRTITLYIHNFVSLSYYGLIRCIDNKFLWIYFSAFIWPPPKVAYFAFSYFSWGSQGKNTEVVCHSLLQWTTFCQTSPPWPTRLGGPRAWLSFIELDKAVVLVWLDWLVFWEYGFSVSALWCPLSTPTVLLGFLLPWMWISLHSSSSKAQTLLLTLDEGYLLTAASPDLEHGVAPLGPPAPTQPLLLGVLWKEWC